MTYFLRNKKNNTILELEFWTKTDYDSDGSKHTYHEISTSINISTYSEFLLETSEGMQETIIQLFDELSEYRGWLWENYYMVKNNTGSTEDKKEIMNHLSETFSNIAKTFGLIYVTD